MNGNRRTYQRGQLSRRRLRHAQPILLLGVRARWWGRVLVFSCGNGGRERGTGGRGVQCALHDFDLARVDALFAVVAHSSALDASGGC